MMSLLGRDPIVNRGSSVLHLQNTSSKIQLLRISRRRPQSTKLGTASSERGAQVTAWALVRCEPLCHREASALVGKKTVPTREGTAHGFLLRVGDRVLGATHQRDTDSLEWV